MCNISTNISLHYYFHNVSVSTVYSLVVHSSQGYQRDLSHQVPPEVRQTDRWHSMKSTTILTLTCGRTVWGIFLPSLQNDQVSQLNPLLLGSPVQGMGFHSYGYSWLFHTKLVVGSSRYHCTKMIIIGLNIYLLHFS